MNTEDNQSRISTRYTLFILPLILISGCISGCMRSTAELKAGGPPLAVLTQSIQVSPPNENASEPAIASAPDGSVYVAWVNHGPSRQADVMIARINSNGERQSSAVRVNSEPGVATAWRGDPPAVAVAPDNTVHVVWTGRVEAASKHATDIYLSSSRDQGQTFAAPVKVNDDAKPNSHGMHSLAVDGDGRIYVAWLDERNVVPMPANGANSHHTESNRELFVSHSTDGGRTFSSNQSIAKDACPCCKTALMIAPDQRLYLSWRQVLPGDFRHIAIAASSDRGESFSQPVIVSDDQWVLKGCPVSGAAMTTDNDGTARVMWYAGREDSNDQGLYWSASKDGGKTFAPRNLVASGFTRSNPLLVTLGDKQVAMWEASVNSVSEIHATTFPGPPKGSIVIAKGELPAAVVQENRVFVSYMVKNGDQQSVWVVSAGYRP
jgi:hypothetical protein